MYFAFAATGLPPSLRDRLREQVGVLLVVALEGDREVEHRLLQQPALGAHLVGGDRLELGAERGVEDAHVALGRRRLACFAASASLPGEQRDCGAGEHESRESGGTRAGGRGRGLSRKRKRTWISPVDGCGARSRVRQFGVRATFATMRSQRSPVEGEGVARSRRRRSRAIDSRKQAPRAEEAGAHRRFGDARGGRGFLDRSSPRRRATRIPCGTHREARRSLASSMRAFFAQHRGVGARGSARARALSSMARLVRGRHRGVISSAAACALPRRRAPR